MSFFRYLGNGDHFPCILLIIRGNYHLVLLYRHMETVFPWFRSMFLTGSSLYRRAVFTFNYFVLISTSVIGALLTPILYRWRGY